MLFKLLGGRHHDRQTGVTLIAKTANDVIESDKDLAAIYGANRFQRVDYSTESVARAARPALDMAAKSVHRPKKQETVEPASEEAEDTGHDVTAEFPTAVEMGMLVHRTGDWYNVTESDSPGEPLNPKGLKRGEVEAFIEEQA